jgi:hypothetical protein
MIRANASAGSGPVTVFGTGYKAKYTDRKGESQEILGVICWK